MCALTLNCIRKCCDIDRRAQERSRFFVANALRFFYRHLDAGTHYPEAMSGAVRSSVGSDADEDGWIPIDDALRAARGVMRSGQMVHAANFQLYHSMNALQILDPKMDVGMAPPAGEAPMKSLAALITEGRAPLDLPDEDQTRVFDALLACEATWHRGQALATTVYTCLYMHDAERLEGCRGPVMRAYFDATRSAVATVRHAVSLGDVWEEEDFVLHVAGFDVGAAACGDDATKTDAALAALLLAETWLVENAGVEDRHGALLARVRFRIAMHEAYAALFGLSDPKRAVAAAAGARASLQRAAAHLATMRTTTFADEKNDGTDPNGLGFDRKLNLSKMGPSPPRAVRLMSVQQGFEYFHELVGELTRLCDVAPLVASGAGSLRDALAFLSAFNERSRNRDPCVVSRSFAAIAILHPKRGGILGKHPGDAALRSAWLFGAAQPPRLRLEDDLAGDDLGGAGDAGGEGDEGDEDAPSRLVGGTASGTLGKSFDDETEEEDAAGAPGTAELCSFLIKTSLGVELLVRAYLCNRSRSRRKLRRLLGEWSALADMAAVVDASGFVPGYLRRLGESAEGGASVGGARERAELVAASGALARSPWARHAFSSWSGCVLVRAMLAHLTLGFELELYLPHELCMVYWYQEYLTDDLQSKLRVIERSLTAHLDAAADAESSLSAATKKNQGKKGDKTEDERARASSVSTQTRLTQVRTEGHILSAHKTMCKGMLRFTAGLSAADRAWRPARGDFTDAEQNFWQRFGIFHAVRDPAPLSHADFEQYVRLGDDVTADRLFELAAECFHGARAWCKELLELPAGALSQTHLEDLAGLDKTAAANAAAARLAIAAPTMRAEFAFAAHHPTFPTVKLVRGG